MTQRGQLEHATLNPDATRHGLRQIAAAGVGNAVEWYDWYTFGFLATIFAGQIFKSGDPLASLLYAYIVFAAGFLLRPIGGLLVGNLADRIGRKSTLYLTILTMGLGSLIIGITPTFDAIGVWSPILLVVGRAISGLSVGGEFAANSVFLVESAPPRRRGFFSSFQYVSTTIGQLLASGLAAMLVLMLSKQEMAAWGWRIPFIVGAVLSLVGIWIRRGAEETYAVAEKTERPGIFHALVKYPRQSLLIVGVTIAGTITYYTWTTYLPTYATKNGGPDTGTMLLISTIALAFFALIQPVVGSLSDRYGRKPFLIGFAAIFTALIIPGLYLVSKTGFWGALLTAMAGMVVLSGYTSIAAALNAEIIPTHVRAGGIGFPYSVAVALFGGTAPAMGTLFADWGNPGLFGWYVMLLTAISLVVYIFLPETAKKPLPE